MSRQTKSGPVSRTLEEVVKLNDSLAGLIARAEEAQKSVARLTSLLKALSPLDSIVNSLSAGQGGAEDEASVRELVSPDTGYAPSEPIPL